ncbi:DUF4112 domain-containing protein [Ferrovibrio sp.]|jgi:hypothetical protein|uniref:DUF4112 domain-containing protein n=1 Tax=Ferrovibrio sp. TaxID=1917215 RepID=UPI0035B47AC8
MSEAFAQFHQNAYGYVSERNIEARRRLEALARLLDNAVRIPGTDIRVGLDAALNVIPGIGTLMAKAMAGYLVWEARRLGVPVGMILRMVGNVAVDLLISSIPVVGWFGDIFYRANVRNIELLHRHIDHSEGMVDAARGTEGN